MDDTTGTQGAGRREAARTGSDLAVTVLSGIAIALPLVFYLHQHGQMLRAGYDIETLERRRMQLAERQGELEARRLAVGSWDRVEQAASGLGLVAPDPRDVAVIAPSPLHPGQARRPDPGDGRGGPVLTSARMD